MKLPKEVIEVLEELRDIHPWETLSSATTALKGVSRCKFCKAEGYFTFSGEREYGHKEGCICEKAKQILMKVAKANSSE